MARLELPYGSVLHHLHQSEYPAWWESNFEDVERAESQSLGSVGALKRLEQGLAHRHESVNRKQPGADLRVGDPKGVDVVRFDQCEQRATSLGEADAPLTVSDSDVAKVLLHLWTDHFEEATKRADVRECKLGFRVEDGSSFLEDFVVYTE